MLRPETCSPKLTRMIRILVAVTAFAAAACSTMQNGNAPDLSTALEVDVKREGAVDLVLHLTNSGTQPVVLEFNSGQRYDFEVRTLADSVVWRWSADQMFTQALGSDSIAAGASREYRETWTPGPLSGSFVAVGRVVATNHAIEQRTQFEISRR